jgi:ABC-type Fe3+-siderophore transport system permease subunit
MMFTSAIFVVVMVVAVVSVQVVPITLLTNYTGVAAYQNTINTDGLHYIHPGASIPLVGLDQERTNTSSAADADYVKYHNRFPTKVIAILVIGSIVFCGGIAWFLYHTYDEFA